MRSSTGPLRWSTTTPKSDDTLQAALHREGGTRAHDDLAAFGARVGSTEVIEWGFLANANTPRLMTHDPYGHRIDFVDYHPAWHSLMRLSVSGTLPEGHQLESIISHVEVA